MRTIIVKCDSQLIESIKHGGQNHFLLELCSVNNIDVGDRVIFVDVNRNTTYVETNITKIKEYSISSKTLADTTSNFICYKNNKYKINSKPPHLKEGIKNFLLIETKTLDYSFKDSLILLDTNIIIQRESASNVQEYVIQALKEVQESQGHLFVCKEIEHELSKHKDKKIVELMHKKLKFYDKMKNDDFVPDELFKTTISDNNDENNLIDNILLGYVYNNKCDFLITNDKGIKTKAEKLFLDNRVLTSDEVLFKLDNNSIALNTYINSNIRLTKFGEVSLSDEFFDSFKEDYGQEDFTKWFRKKFNENCYVYKKDDKINGFLYLKIEDESEKYDDFIRPFETKKRRLKVGTFKIISSGERLGEKFLQIIIDNALSKNIDEIYLTLFDKDRNELRALKNLLLDWGFIIYTNKKSNGEMVLTKNLNEYNEQKSIKQNYPKYPKNPKIYYLPINFEYHDRMYSDSKRSITQSLFDSEKAVSNALEKIYITKVNRKEDVAPGDLLMIYQIGEEFRSKRYSSRLTNIAIFEKLYKTKSLTEFLNLCKNRTVFSKNELVSFYNKGYTTIIKFIHLKQLKREIILNTLWEENIIEPKSGPRILSALSSEDYSKILKLSEM